MKNNSTLIYSNDGIIIYADNLSLEQKDVLLSLAEQGVVEEKEENFFVTWNSVVSFEDDLRYLFGLPPIFDGKLYVNFDSYT